VAAREIWILFCCVETAPMDREQWRHGAAASLPTALLGLRPQQTDRFSSFTEFCFYVNHDGLVDTTSTRKFEDWQEAGKKNLKKKKKTIPNSPHTFVQFAFALPRCLKTFSARGGRQSRERAGGAEQEQSARVPATGLRSPLQRLLEASGCARADGRRLVSPSGGCMATSLSNHQRAPRRSPASDFKTNIKNIFPSNLW